MSKLKICVVSGSRAEFGQLLPLLQRLTNDSFFELDFVVTGSHLLQRSGNTLSEISENNIKVNEKIPIKSADDNSRHGIAKQIGDVIVGFAEYLSKKTPDLMLLIGDRFEMFGVAIAASTLLIPIAHICGGSTTSGAIDEIYRHSITKMSSLHFTTCSEYRNRVIQLGENPKNVYNVGSLAIENCLKVELMSEQEFRDCIGLKENVPYCVVTFHPTTLEKNASEQELLALVEAMNTFMEYSYVITLSNVDAGGDHINQMWKSIAAERENYYVVPSLGMKRYLSALKYSEMMIGNSSSGTTEGPSMKIPTIDIGDRQKGRFFANSIIHCEPLKNDIILAMNRARSSEFRESVKNVTNPFGDGTTSERILSILKDRGRNLDIKKDFYDLSVEDFK